MYLGIVAGASVPEAARERSADCHVAFSADLDDVAVLQDCCLLHGMCSLSHCLHC